MNTLFLGFDKLPPYTDGQIVELSYQNNVLKLTLKNYKEEIVTYSFLNIFQLSFENYLNEDIDEIRTFWEERGKETRAHPSSFLLSVFVGMTSVGK